MSTIIRLQDLTKYYGKTRGITGINLNVEEGEIYGFIGPNGAGKSTTIRLLMSLIYPTSGYAEVFGKDAIKHGPEVRNNIGYLPSEVFYYEKMKVKDLLSYSASFYKKDCSKRINELADIMSLDLNKRIEALSYGNKKKVGIVQGLLHEPKLIILDEPTSGLDPLMQKNFFDLIQRENEKGATVFFSSHILAEVQALCNRVAIIKDGKIIKEDDVKSLRENHYKKVSIKSGDLNEQFSQMAGVTLYETYENECHFMYNGDMSVLLQKAYQVKPEDILIEDPSLEEIFMHYYQA